MCFSMTVPLRDGGSDGRIIHSRGKHAPVVAGSIVLLLSSATGGNRGVTPLPKPQFRNRRDRVLIPAPPLPRTQRPPVLPITIFPQGVLLPLMAGISICFRWGLCQQRHTWRRKHGKLVALPSPACRPCCLFDWALRYSGDKLYGHHDGGMAHGFYVGGMAHVTYVLWPRLIHAGKRNMADHHLSKGPLLKVRAPALFIPCGTQDMKKLLP